MDLRHIGDMLVVCAGILYNAVGIYPGKEISEYFLV